MSQEGNTVKVGDKVHLRRFKGTAQMCWHPAMDAIVDQVVQVEALSTYEPGAIVVNDRQMRKWTWPKGAFDLVAVQALSEVPFRPFDELMPAMIAAHNGEWQDALRSGRRYRMEARSDGIAGDFTPYSPRLSLPEHFKPYAQSLSFRPISKDGIPVPWATLEALSKEMQCGAHIAAACASLNNQVQKEKEPNMPSIPASVAPASAPSRNRSAVNEALRRAPVEWSLDEAHEMIVKLAVGTVKVRAHKPIIKAWVEEQLQSEYGKALLGVVVGNVAPLVAPHLGRGEQLVQRVSDELLAVSYKKAMVRAARDLKKMGGPLLKMGMKLFATLFDRVEDAERMREVAALGAGSEGNGLFAEAAVSDKVPTAAQR